MTFSISTNRLSSRSATAPATAPMTKRKIADTSDVPQGNQLQADSREESQSWAVFGLLLDLISADIAVMRKKPLKKIKKPPSPQTVRAIFFLALQQDSITVNKLATGLGLSSPRASRIADELVKAGLLVRDRNETDRRELELKLTAQALEFSAALWDTRKTAIGRVLDQFNGGEIETIKKFLATIAREYKEQLSGTDDDDNAQC